MTGKQLYILGSHCSERAGPLTIAVRKPEKAAPSEDPIVPFGPKQVAVVLSETVRGATGIIGDAMRSKSALLREVPWF